MLDIGWSEMAIVAVIALFVIGPRELPRLLRTVGRYAAKVRGMAREFQDGIDEAVREAELDEVRKQIESAGRVDVGKAIEDAVDPERSIGKAMDFRQSGKESAGKDKAGKETAADAKPAGESAAGEAPAAAAPEPEPAPPAKPVRAAGMAASVAAAAPPAPRVEAAGDSGEAEAPRAEA